MDKAKSANLIEEQDGLLKVRMAENQVGDELELLKTSKPKYIY